MMALEEKTVSCDHDLQQSVLAELSWEPSVDSAHIGVTANAGVVTLTGHVESFSQKVAADAAARRVKGVKAVAEDIEIRLPFEMKRSDEEIGAAAASRLAWDSALARKRIEVEVAQGRLTLTGQVDHKYQKVAAEEAVRFLLGVVGVRNLITLTSGLNASDVGEDIRAALRRGWLADPDTIIVKVDAGNVVLSGTAKSWQDRQVADAAAWAAPGAISVVNEIAIL